MQTTYLSKSLNCSLYKLLKTNIMAKFKLETKKAISIMSNAYREDTTSTYSNGKYNLSGYIYTAKRTNREVEVISSRLTLRTMVEQYIMPTVTMYKKVTSQVNKYCDKAVIYIDLDTLKLDYNCVGDAILPIHHYDAAKEEPLTSDYVRELTIEALTEYLK